MSEWQQYHLMNVHARKAALNRLLSTSRCSKQLSMVKTSKVADVAVCYAPAVTPRMLAIIYSIE